MANRAEDLIGQYLMDLFAPAVDAGDSQMPSDTTAAEAPAPPKDAPHTPPVAPTANTPTVPARPQPRPSPRQAAAETTLTEPARLQLQQLLNSGWQAPAPVLVPDVKAEAEPASEPAIAPAQAFVKTPPLLAGKPAWATKTFDTLLVDVAGLTLAIPLVVLGHIFRVQDGFSHLPGQGPLFLGTLSTARGPLRVINTALLVMPERYDAACVEQVQFVVSLATEPACGQPWQLALAVNRVAQPVSLACDDVVWRGERSKRPWLLGTVKSHMCALLDVDVISQMLAAPTGG